MILIAQYDPRWPARFSEEAERIRRTFGSLALRIEHVGSTSVPGLDSKPVIDIQISVLSLESRGPYYRLLTALGYTHFPLGTFDLVYPFFKRPQEWPSTHHVHLCNFGSQQERDHLAFRDYLRRDCNLIEKYSALKRKLATEHDGITLESQEQYSLAKTDFVNLVLSQVSEKRQRSEPHADA